MTHLADPLPTGALPTGALRANARSPGPGLAPGPSGSGGDDPGEAIAALVDQLATEDRFVHRHRDPARPASHGDPAEPVGLGGGAHPLWSHQAAAIDALRSGESVVLSTPTASGKSLCYQVPALEAAARGGCSLMVFPTKALAHDQLHALARRAPDGVTAAAYDGDCSPTERSWVRNHAQIVLTNPEMLHLGILANHTRWERFLRHLELVVVDELHVLRGVFGSHVAHVLRRLRRLVAAHRGTEPTFAFTSATIGEPTALAQELAGVPVRPVERSGAPTGERTTVLWNPLHPGTDPGQRAPLSTETARLAAELVGAGLRTLVFCRSRRASELVANDVRTRLAGAGVPDAASLVRSYRAGYLAEERREIEVALAEDRLRCVVATNALELGIDVAGLDAVVLSGFPGTIASFRQQVGRAGRGTRSSLAVLVAGEDQLDQWIMRHPREAFRRAPEPAVVNPSNPHVLLPHLGCAADELPLTRRDERFWPDVLDDGVRDLVLSDRLRIDLVAGSTAAGGTAAGRPEAAGADTDPQRREGGAEAGTGNGPVARWCGRGAPAPTIGLRSAARGEFTIRRDDGTAVGTVDAARAPSTVHEGAVYLHQGSAWRVVELDLAGHVARVEPDDGDTYTQTHSDTEIRLLDEIDRAAVDHVGVHLGRVEVTTRVTAFTRRTTDRHEVVERVELDLPPAVLDTTALWWVFGAAIVEAAGLSPTRVPGALHAAEHAGIGILPLFALCDRWDVGGVSTPWLPETSAPTVVIHDAQPGGAGAAAMAFEAAPRHLATTLEVLTGCPCAAGCPSCVQSPKCGNGNEPLDKEAAGHLLSSGLGRHEVTHPRP